MRWIIVCLFLVSCSTEGMPGIEYDAAPVCLEACEPGPQGREAECCEDGCVQWAEGVQGVINCGSCGQDCEPLEWCSHVGEDWFCSATRHDM